MVEHFLQSSPMKFSALEEAAMEPQVQDQLRFSMHMVGGATAPTEYDDEGWIHGKYERSGARG